jgi:hypothetical protein
VRLATTSVVYEPGVNEDAFDMCWSWINSAGGSTCARSESAMEVDARALKLGAGRRATCTMREDLGRGCVWSCCDVKAMIGDIYVISGGMKTS